MVQHGDQIGRRGAHYSRKRLQFRGVLRLLKPGTYRAAALGKPPQAEVGGVYTKLG